MAQAKIHTLLLKIQSIIGHEESISRLEKDLVKDYLRELYDLTETIPTTGVSKPIRVTEPVAVFRPEVEDQSPPPIQKPEPVAVPPMMKQPLPAIESSPKPEYQHFNGTKETIIEPATRQQPDIQYSNPPITEVFRQETVIPQKYSPLFEGNQSKDLSDKLSRAPISDLMKAFSINDRLLVVADLFNGDQQKFQDTIDILNTKYSFDEAKSYLLRYMVDQYEWLSEERLERAREFIKFVERRFLGR
ncbi:MAG: hypothetical protein IPL46_11490 [Saprospiraceae bacterium]|nr:hypothetical protein [Saprospiraceae bacterium]